MHILCDFDGTVSLSDTTDWILSRFAAPAWRSIEAQWTAGRITARECMRTQIAMIEATSDELDRALERVEIDASFKNFVRWTDDENIPLTVVSDGVDYFIRRVLARHGLSGVHVVANTLVREGASLKLLQPIPAAHCSSGTCKCAVAAASAGPIVFIGDGRSDFCVSDKVDLLFAKDALLTYARTHAIECMRFDSFSDVRRALCERRALCAPAALSS